MEEDEVFTNFVLSARQIHSRKEHRRCCENVSKTFLLYLIYVWKQCVAIVLAAVFCNIETVKTVVPSSLVFLVILAATLTNKPTLGQSITSLYAFPLYFFVQIIATGVAYVIPTDQPAVVALLIFLGVFLFHMADLNLGVPKLCSAIWIIALNGKYQTPSSDPIVLAKATIIGLCFSCCACMIAQLLPPYTSIKEVDHSWEVICRNSCSLIRSLRKEFVKESSHEKFKIGRLKVEDKLRTLKSIPLLISGDVKSMHTLVETTSGQQYLSANKVEKNDALTEKIEVAIRKIQSSLNFIQAERPFGSMVMYKNGVRVFKMLLIQLKGARGTIAGLNSHQDSRMHDFRLALKPLLWEFTDAIMNCLETLELLPRNHHAVTQFENAKELLRECFKKVQFVIFEKRKQFFGARNFDDINQISSTREIMSTYFFLSNMSNICDLMVKFETPNQKFIPYSSDAVKVSFFYWFQLWFFGVSRSNKNISKYLRSEDFKTKLSSALVVSSAVAATLCFVLIPRMKEVFSQGTWVTFTALFVFTPKSGATIRAARDRMLGIFIGTSYSYIALLILRNIVGEGATLPIVGIIVFVVVYAAVVLILFQDNPSLVGACLYAVILVLFSIPTDVRAQSAYVLSNFLNTFIGAAIVTLFSSYAFFFQSSRYELLKHLDINCAELSAILTTIIARLDLTALEKISRFPVTERLFAMEASLARMQIILEDLDAEPVLWRPPIRTLYFQNCIKHMRDITTALHWIDITTMRFLIDTKETRENGLLENPAILAVIAMKSEISDALLEVGELVHFGKHPRKKIPMGWRPFGIRIAREKLNQTAIKSAILENLYMKGQREEILANRQVVALTSLVHVLDIFLAEQVSRLWLDVYKVITECRRGSIFYRTPKKRRQSLEHI